MIGGLWLLVVFAVVCGYCVAVGGINSVGVFFYF